MVCTRVRVLIVLGSALIIGALSTTTSVASATHLNSRHPSRIISLSPTATEVLFAIGAGHQVVAVDGDSDYPKNAPRTSLSGLEPNLEAIARYRPQLVVISYNPNNLEKSLERLGISVLFQDAPASLSGTYSQIERLGEITGHVNAARSLVERMRREIAAAVRTAPHFAKVPTYYYELDQTEYSVTSSTFIGRLVKMFGLRDIADAAKGASSGYPQLSTEYIVKSNPSLIFLADTICCHQSLTTLAKRPGFRAMSA
ncbi:MAG: ABC transporter substrate-binding protein, partial [Acidimicrobiales bacterium]